jgi:hypothetical protein
MISPGHGGVLAVAFWHWASRTVNQDFGQTCCFLLLLLWACGQRG